MTDPSGAPQILYVLGRGRSGSTVFARALGALEGFFFAGEVRTLWDPILVHDSRCTCGEPVSRCPVWSQVLARLEDVDRAEVGRWQREVVREARLGRLLRAGATGWPALSRYRRVMGRLYRAVADVTGCRTIVDSSKRPSYALVVKDMPDSDSRFVQLVRDPRACAHSWRTRDYRGAVGGRVRQRGAFDATLRWDMLNLGAEAVLRAAGPGRARRVRYEDFAAAPRECVGAVSAMVGGPDVGTAFVDERTVRAPTGHALAGNPAAHGPADPAADGAPPPMLITQDARWWSAQRPVDRWTASVVSFPLLMRYRYRLFSPDSVV